MIKIKRIAEFGDIDRKRWQELLNLSIENHIFQTYEFASIWWKHFGGSNKNIELLLLAVEDGDSIMAVAPLMLKKIPYINSAIIQFIGTDICDYMDFIIAPSDYFKYFHKIMEYLSGLRFLEIDLKYISGDAKIVKDFGSYEAFDNIYGNIRKADQCPYIDLQQDWETIMGSVRKKLSDEIHRNERKMRERGEVMFKTHEPGSQIAHLLDAYFTLHVKKWKHYGGKFSQFQYKRWRDFVTELSSTISDGGWLDLTSLEFNKNIVACHFGFGYNNRLYYYMPTFDPALSVYSPAKILIMKMLERSYKNGLKEFDFLRGMETYKMAWTKTARPIYNIRYYSNKGLSRYSGFLYRVLRDGYDSNIKPALKKVKPLMHAWYGSRGDK